MKLKALKPTENITANQIRPFTKKNAKPPMAKYLLYLFLDKMFLKAIFKIQKKRRLLETPK